MKMCLVTYVVLEYNISNKVNAFSTNVWKRHCRLFFKRNNSLKTFVSSVNEEMSWNLIIHFKLAIYSMIVAVEFGLPDNFCCHKFFCHIINQNEYYDWCFWGTLLTRGAISNALYITLHYKIWYLITLTLLFFTDVFILSVTSIDSPLEIVNWQWLNTITSCISPKIIIDIFKMIAKEEKVETTLFRIFFCFFFFLREQDDLCLTTSSPPNRRRKKDIQ